MSVQCHCAETVHTTPERAFAVLDDLPLTARWLPPCVSLEKVGAGPNAPGDRLRYVYRHGGRTAEMAGEIVARIPGERIHCRYFDSTFEVSVDLRVAPAAGGEALTTHLVEITPKRLLARLFSPLIRIGLEKQTRQAAANLKQLLETGVPQTSAGGA